MNRYPLIPAVSILAALWLSAACTHAPSTPSTPSTPSKPSAPSTPAYITTAVADSNRPAADTQRDANRKPAETLVFVGVRSGDQIGELVPGGGYFTRIFSKAVGPTGHVYALVPPRPANPSATTPDRGAAARALAADPNYTNISVVELTTGKVTTPVPVDLIFTAQNYHDLHNIPTLDIAGFNKSVFDSLKPGGLFVVLDHSAAAGSAARDTNTLHRIDMATVKSEVMAAGFEFVASSDILANPADPRTANVFDPAIRGKTDQFILKFRKPIKK